MQKEADGAWLKSFGSFGGDDLAEDGLANGGEAVRNEDGESTREEGCRKDDGVPTVLTGVEEVRGGDKYAAEAVRLELRFFTGGESREGEEEADDCCGVDGEGGTAESEGVEAEPVDSSESFSWPLSIMSFTYRM